VATNQRALRTRLVVKTARRQPNSRVGCRRLEFDREQSLRADRAELPDNPCLLDEASGLEREESPVVSVTLAVVDDIEPVRLSDVRVHANGSRLREPAVEGLSPSSKDRATSGAQDLLDHESIDEARAVLSRRFSPLLLIVHRGPPTIALAEQVSPTADFPARRDPAIDVHVLGTAEVF
jgi:hypothetical protein